MNSIDWLLFAVYVGILYWAWTTNTNPLTAMTVRLQRIKDEGGANVPVRHERKRDKRTGN